MSKDGRILFIDAYDSFSNNIISLLKSKLPVTVEVIKINDHRFVLNDDAFLDFLAGFDAVVAGPGPGHPANAADVGLIARLWSLADDHIIPVLGICLGFQSLALELGAKVERLEEPRHGLVTPVVHSSRDIFADTGDVVATQYHSLHVRLDSGTARGTSIWKPAKACSEFIPLAWDFSDGDNGPILMAARHCHKPFWGVQYHPESICTNKEGQKLVVNWWNEVVAWQSRRSIRKERLLEREAKAVGNVPSRPLKSPTGNVVQYRTVRLVRQISTIRIVEDLRNDSSRYEPILLQSGMRGGKPVNVETGRFSIIGIHDAEATHVRYSTKSGLLDIVVGDAVLKSYQAKMSDVFELLESFTSGHAAVAGPTNIPFWGGFIGFVSYEAGLETIEVIPPEVNEEKPDLWFVFVERSVVVDHVDNVAYVQSIRDGDEAWLVSVEHRLLRLNHLERPESDANAKEKTIGTISSSPQGDEYRHKVRLCQEHLRAGLSYELCLTDTTTLRNDADSWDLYRRLHEINPAPFGAYLRFEPPSSAAGQGISVVSSSPERFLSWSRDGKCQFRPIKGTVKKTPDMTRAKAEELLSCPKEMAENLMIVDLIRHDLSGVEGVQHVQVPKLMVVEEYETVFQLVSVISGDVGENGLRALAASLPPGSMTGAPKKRSCELLKSVEQNRPRGLYSGVIGYLDVGGGGDFSVVIRTAFKWDDDGAEWRIGAGGAVTAMSDAEAEWQEMMAKRETLLRAFE